MSDDKSKTHPLDAQRIDIHDKNEVKSWSKSLGCSEAQLKAAVGKVGTSGKAVRQHLQGNA
ncbi:DUF3606 domain-containing protein [Chitinivorax sp. B]|uniref:DUF3606 domain-containing protein n=1 Tax=Chitinivorax sp. B TaxID=2502235 RepID=UPI0010F44B08|nr:DUF3606 domain-containing protein [Chitinivorax sp. B]